MKIVSSVAVLWLILSLLADPSIAQINQCKFEDIKTSSWIFKESLQDGSQIFENTILNYGKIQVRVDNKGLIMTERWATAFDIRTINNINYSPPGKTLLKCLSEDTKSWLIKHLSEVDKFSIKDHFFSNNISASKVTIIYTAKTRHLEVMIKF